MDAIRSLCDTVSVSDDMTYVLVTLVLCLTMWHSVFVSDDSTVVSVSDDATLVSVSDAVSVCDDVTFVSVSDDATLCSVSDDGYPATTGKLQ